MANDKATEAVLGQRFDNVWDALSDSPAEAREMTLRSTLMLAVEDVVMSWGVPQAEAAARLGITQPRLNDLLRGRIEKFSLDFLVATATAAGLEVSLEIGPGKPRAA